MSFQALLREHSDLIQRIDPTEIQRQLNSAIDLLAGALSRNLPVLVCGNGGSAADAQHIAGELVGKFLRKRRALNVQCLSSNSSVVTAWANDVSFESLFARQVEAHGAPGGVLIGLSTSGHSRNVLEAATVARALGMSVISFTGVGGGSLRVLSDVVLEAPTSSTPRVQEFHILFYHYICEHVEARIDKDPRPAGEMME